MSQQTAGYRHLRPFKHACKSHATVKIQAKVKHMLHDEPLQGETVKRG